MHFNLIKDLLRSYNEALQIARSAYLSNLINANHHNSKFLFDLINSLVNPVKDCILSCIDCEEFLVFFRKKVNRLRASMAWPVLVAGVQGSSLVWLSSFSPLLFISLCDLKDTVHRVKPSPSPMDMVLARLLQQLIEVAGISPALLDLIISFLTTGCVLDHFSCAASFEKNLTWMLHKPTVTGLSPNFHLF